MTGENNNEAQINKDDIVFECDHCGNTLVINYQGAGLTVECSECKQQIQVPIPEGLELSDLDRGGEESPEKESAQVTLNESSTAEGVSGEEKAESPKEGPGAEPLDREDSDNSKRFQTLRERLQFIRETLGEIDDILRQIEGE